MARIALLCPDLLFGSRVEGGLRVAGHDVERFDDEPAARAAASGADLLVVDLTTDAVDGPALVAAMREAGELSPPRTLGFFSHVDQETRRRAEDAGFDQVVPRSRMARDMAALAERLLAA